MSCLPAFSYGRSGSRKSWNPPPATRGAPKPSFLLPFRISAPFHIFTQGDFLHHAYAFAFPTFSTHTHPFCEYHVNGQSQQQQRPRSTSSGRESWKRQSLLRQQRQQPPQGQPQQQPQRHHHHQQQLCRAKGDSLNEHTTNSPLCVYTLLLAVLAASASAADMTENK